MPAAELGLLRDVLDEVHELFALGATRVEAVGMAPENDGSLRVVITSDKLDEPKVIAVREGGE